MIKKLGQKACSALRLPLREKLWILMLFPYSGLIRVGILLLPFRFISPFLGQHYQNNQLCSLPSEEEKLLAWRVGRITELVARYTPWESKCLVQAIIARTLLRFYHIDYVLHLGAKMTNEKDKPMKAHAWLVVGPWIITGREGHKSYGIVATYVSHRFKLDG